jgi:hypothetical protein
VYTINLLQAGVVIASTRAAYTRSGNTFTAADPASLNAWIHGYAGSIDEVDITVDNVGVSQVDGTNSLSLSASYNGGTYASATTTWQAPAHENF